MTDRTRGGVSFLTVRRCALLVLLLIALLTGCGKEHGPSAGGTDLTIRAVNSSVGRSEFHLSCEPPGGDLPDPARSCAALAKDPKLVTKPEPFTCAGGMFSGWDVEITGRLSGKPIDTEFSTCWTIQMATLERFGMDDEVREAHMLPRRHESVLPESRRVFEPGTLEVGDEITCDIRGHHLDAGVPSYVGEPMSIAYNGRYIVGVTMTVELHEDGSLVADCHTDR